MKTLLTISAVLLFGSGSIAQLKTPELSPSGIVKQIVGFTTITVRYERPAARGRTEKEIFGELVPYGKIWRTGAGPCTKISFSTDVTINKKVVNKGTYSLFTIPDKNSWTIILNTDTVSYGPYSYDERKDVVRIFVKPQPSHRHYESLTIDIDVIPNDARIYISWLNTQVSFDVSTGVDKQILSFIYENLILKDSRDPQLYESAIQYYIWHQKDRKQILTFIEKGIALRNDRTWYYWKVNELKKDKKYTEALEAARTAIDVIRKGPEEQGYNKTDLIKDFQNMIDEIGGK